MSKEPQEVIDEYVKGDGILMQTEASKTKLKQPLVLNLDPEKEREYELNCIKEEARNNGLAQGIAQGIAQGRAEGIAQGRVQNNKENAKKMKENGIADELIIKITGLTKKQISML